MSQNSPTSQATRLARISIWLVCLSLLFVVVAIGCAAGCAYVEAMAAYPSALDSMEPSSQPVVVWAVLYTVLQWSTVAFGGLSIILELVALFFAFRARGKFKREGYAHEASLVSRSMWIACIWAVLFFIPVLLGVGFLVLIVLLFIIKSL